MLLFANDDGLGLVDICLNETDLAQRHDVMDLNGSPLGEVIGRLESREVFLKPAARL